MGEALPTEITGRPFGVSLIAGERADTQDVQFDSITQASGATLQPTYTAASPAQVSEAARKAWSAFHAAGLMPPSQHAALLRPCADGIDAIGEPLVALASAETAIEPARLNAELARTTGTLRMFADVVEEGSWVDAIIDRPGAEGRPSSRQALRRMLRPLGPVAVFGASNFPLAYSTAGTDTASALAAGCPVIVKGHPLHPGTGEVVAQAIAASVLETGFPAGWFSFLHAGGGREQEIGEELVKHPCVRAAGFTGSRTGGDALTRIGLSRPDPIPVYAEMGSVNPVIVLPGALASEPEKIARRVAQSLAAAVGQQCTCPGLIFLIDGEGSDMFTKAMSAELELIEAGVMLAPRIQANYTRTVRELLALEEIKVLFGTDRVPAPPPPGKKEVAGPAMAAPMLLSVAGEHFRQHAEFLNEMFGPCALVVQCQNEQELFSCVTAFVGSLTGSLFVGDADVDRAPPFARALEQRCGRLIFNGVPTGVEVAWAMVHGGPYPASNRPDTSAVGPTAMKRWRRPVCYQNYPANLLPPELRDENPLGIERRVDGTLTREPV
ncbi:MAG: aldehyde dehydrogenase (NADP(+)) [Phycisphaerae bacterium]|nr:aldehyde dehydrogenase (NADP(+)) [Phycisphaerae bacterium]